MLEKVIYVISAVHDVSERKRIEEVRQQLMQREWQAKEAECEMARLRSLFSQAPALIHILRGPDHVFEFFHPLGKELVGGRDLTGMKVREALPEYEGQGYFELLDHIYQTGESYRNNEMSSVLKAADGKMVERFFSTIFQPWFDVDGRIAGILNFAVEVTDLVCARQQLEESEACLRAQTSDLERANSELRRQRDELVQADVDLEKANRGRQFFSTMSHELRTPLASIIGFSQLLLAEAEETGWTQQQKSNLERILKNGQHLLNLINDVLDLVKIEAGRMEISFTRVDVREIISWVVEETSSLAIEKKLDVKTIIADEVSPIESNPVKLRQVLLNLVSNALKYTDHGGVTISAMRRGEGGEDRLALTVQDTGIGISSEMQEHVFEAFYQVDGGYTRKSGGTGLGLAIVSQLTSLLGGKIELKSAPGQGSTFTLILPVKPIAKLNKQDTSRVLSGWEEDTGLPIDSATAPASIPAEDIEPGASVLSSREERNLVLAVDDDPDVIALIRTSLRDTSYSVIGVQDPLKLIELVQEMHPSAITLDVLMPDLSGWQILRQLKSNPATTSIPVIMLSVLSQTETGYGLGADDYLIKPFQKEVLLKTLQSLVSSHKASSPVLAPDNRGEGEAVQVQQSHDRT